MIFGICSKENIQFDQEILPKLIEAVDRGQSQSSAKAGFYYLLEPLKTGHSRQSGLWREPKSTLLFQGHIFNEQEIRQQAGLPATAEFPQVVLKIFERNGAAAFSKLNGHFTIAIFENDTQKLTLVRDHFGVEPLYYFQDEKRILFCSDPQVLLKELHLPREINHKGLYTYLLFNYIPLTETLVANLKKLPPAHTMTWKNATSQIQRYWYLSFKPDRQTDENYYTEKILRLLQDAVSIRLEANARPGAFLSGGMDSSSIVGLTHNQLQQPLHTFSFRCKGESFDESHYAQIMSDAYHTQHHLVEFPAEESRDIIKLVDLMPEPFCDIGIEVASFLLAQHVGQYVDYILTGDGGDELFAGHPVYIADRVARIFDAVPGFIRAPVIWGSQFLPDTDQKKSLAVKVKRFSYSFNFPPTLFSNRWRIYYTRKELEKAIEPGLWQKLQEQNPLADIAANYQQADGEDFLSKTLYGDYLTVVNFYMTRMNILRHFGVEARFPMFDYRLVEFAATIPADLKIKGNKESKYILKKTMTGILPDAIVFRKDKLGHSVPMKNWMRDAEPVKSLLFEVLSESHLRRRGFFKPQFVQQMLAEHQSKKVNHSHRLWALMVLELWLQKHFD